MPKVVAALLLWVPIMLVAVYLPVEVGVLVNVVLGASSGILLVQAWTEREDK